MNEWTTVGQVARRLQTQLGAAVGGSVGRLAVRERRAPQAAGHAAGRDAQSGQTAETSHLRAHDQYCQLSGEETAAPLGLGWGGTLWSGFG